MLYPVLYTQHVVHLVCGRCCSPRISSIVLIPRTNDEDPDGFFSCFSSGGESLRGSLVYGTVCKLREPASVLEWEKREERALFGEKCASFENICATLLECNNFSSAIFFLCSFSWVFLLSNSRLFLAVRLDHKDNNEQCLFNNWEFNCLLHNGQDLLPQSFNHLWLLASLTACLSVCLSVCLPTGLSVRRRSFRVEADITSFLNG